MKTLLWITLAGFTIGGAWYYFLAKLAKRNLGARICLAILGSSLFLAMFFVGNNIPDNVMPRWLYRFTMRHGDLSEVCVVMLAVGLLNLVIPVLFLFPMRIGEIVRSKLFVLTTAALGLVSGTVWVKLGFGHGGFCYWVVMPAILPLLMAGGHLLGNYSRATLAPSITFFAVYYVFHWLPIVVTFIYGLIQFSRHGFG